MVSAGEIIKGDLGKSAFLKSSPDAQKIKDLGWLLAAPGFLVACVGMAALTMPQVREAGLELVNGARDFFVNSTREILSRPLGWVGAGIAAIGLLGLAKKLLYIQVPENEIWIGQHRFDGYWQKASTQKAVAGPTKLNRLFWKQAQVINPDTGDMEPAHFRAYRDLSMVVEVDGLRVAGAVGDDLPDVALNFKQPVHTWVVQSPKDALIAYNGRVNVNEEARRAVDAALTSAYSHASSSAHGDKPVINAQDLLHQDERPVVDIILTAISSIYAKLKTAKDNDIGFKDAEGNVFSADDVAENLASEAPMFGVPVQRLLRVPASIGPLAVESAELDDKVIREQNQTAAIIAAARTYGGVKAVVAQRNLEKTTTALQMAAGEGSFLFTLQGADTLFNEALSAIVQRKTSTTSSPPGLNQTTTPPAPPPPPPSGGSPDNTSGIFSPERIALATVVNVVTERMSKSRRKRT